MGLRRGSKYYVRGNYTVKGSSFTEKDYQDHLSYIESVARERYLIGGGFSNIDGGMILFAADNFDKAQKSSPERSSHGKRHLPIRSF
jgi:hypothetical protein